MKLIKTTLVGLIGLTMMFAQDQGQGDQQPPPEAQAYMQKYQETGDANEAFEAAAAVVRANAEQGDDWDEELFNDCKAEAKGAHDGVMDDVGDPQEAFKAAMEAACVCSGDCPPYNPSIMQSVHKYKKNDWAVDESKQDNEEWMAAYDDYDNWKDWRPSGGDDHGDQGGDHGDQGGDHGDQGGNYGDQGGNYGDQGGNYGDQGGDHGDQGGDHGDQDGDHGPPPFEEVDTDGDGLISRDEARAMFGKDPEGNDDPNFDEGFDQRDTNGDGSVDPAEYEAGNKNDHGGDCGHFPMDDEGSVMVSLPDGSERWLMAGEYTMNDDGSLTVNKDGEPDNGATVTPPPCNDDGGSNN